jgi:hypothetical protein
MNLKLITNEIAGASADELSKALRLISSRLAKLHDTVIIDQNGRAVVSDTRHKIDALANTLHDLVVREQAALLGHRQQ